MRSGWFCYIQQAVKTAIHAFPNKVRRSSGPEIFSFELIHVAVQRVLCYDSYIVIHKCSNISG